MFKLKSFFTLILIFICMTSSWAKISSKMQYKYNQKKSVGFNEKQFLKNIKQDCKDYGYSRKWNELSPDDVLQTYPKELAFLYFKKHINSLCYYSASRLIKYLHNDFKKQTEKLIVQAVKDCIGKQKKYPICQDINKQSTLYDLTVMLGSYCSRNTLNAFKQVNCHYKDVSDHHCSLYKNLNKPLKNCPNYFTNMIEVKDLHKSYFGSHCKRLKWKKPSCIN